MGRRPCAMQERGRCPRDEFYFIPIRIPVVLATDPPLLLASWRMAVRKARTRDEKALIVAASNDDDDAMGDLLARGVSVNCKDDDGYTPLHWAAERGNVKKVWLLLRSGASLTAKDKFGDTPGDDAADEKRESVVALLKLWPILKQAEQEHDAARVAAGPGAAPAARKRARG